MSGRRVVVTGIGGELGSRVGALLEDQTWVGEIVGIDANPPRRRLRRTVVHVVETQQHDVIAQRIVDANPHVIIHLGVWEPDARLSSHDAQMYTQAFGHAVFEATLQVPALESVVLRSGIEVYGENGHSPLVPNEHQLLEPQSLFGHMLLGLEHKVSELAIARGTTATLLRLAPVVGPHVPSPLGRMLRLPAVPFNPMSSARFSVIEDGDAAQAFVSAAQHQPHGAVNVVAEGSLSITQAAAVGHRFAIPTIGPGWWAAKSLAKIAGAPVPEHVIELLSHGRLASSESMLHMLNFEPLHSTKEVLTRLYEWPSVIRIQPTRKVA
jgi:UDP-glucose 4-epimerase